MTAPTPPPVESLAELLHPSFDGTGSYCPWSSRGLCPGWRAALFAAEKLLAAGYRSPAEVERLLAEARAEFEEVVETLIDTDAVRIRYDDDEPGEFVPESSLREMLDRLAAALRASVEQASERPTDPGAGVTGGPCLSSSSPTPASVPTEQASETDERSEEGA